MALIGALVLGLAATPAVAGSVADFYKGKRITLYVGSSPGGGYDTYGRLITRHIGRFIPGNPKFTVKNKVGAGSIVVANFVYNVAPQDGSVIVGLQRNLPLVEIMGQKGPKFESSKFHWLGSLANEAGVCAVDKRTGIKSFDETFTKSVLMGGTGPNDTEITPALLNNTLNTKFQLIKGYPSTPPAHLAIQRGEVDGICQSWSSFKAIAGRYYSDGNMVPILQLSLKKHPELTKLGVPLVFEYINKEHVAPGVKVEDVTSYFRLLMAAKAMGRPFAVAPGVPPDRVKALRAAFIAVAKDPKFLADAKKQRREVNLVTGAEIQDIIKQMAATPKAVLAKLDGLMKFRGKAKMAKVEMLVHTGKVTKTKKGGRRIFIDFKGKEVKAKVSGSRTKVTVNGKKAKRKKVKVGMRCTFTYPGPGMEAKKIDCKS
jgi:tripartite-type tricarboxylate transporter receptor subunit TctC